MKEQRSLPSNASPPSRARLPAQRRWWKRGEWVRLRRDASARAWRRVRRQPARSRRATPGDSFLRPARRIPCGRQVRAIPVEVRPEEGTAYAALGHALLRGNDLDKAEAALQRASGLQPKDAQIAEDLGRVHLARKDDKGAMPFLADALRLDPQHQELWFEKARSAERLHDSSLAMESFEKGLALGGSQVAESLSLLRLYVASKQNPKALALAARVREGLPPDPALRTQFATARRIAAAGPVLLAWRRVLEVERASEPAHYRIARLLLESGDAKARRRRPRPVRGRARLGAALPVKADALEKQGRDTRRVRL